MVKNDLGKRGRWTEEEDSKLRKYVISNGGHHWDTVARYLGIGRSGNSCRLRWVNYLSIVRSGKITDEEMMRILTLQSEFGNKWAKIARRLPGRTDNDIKNLWHTRVKREAKKLNCVAGSQEFLEKFKAIIQVAAEPPFTTTTVEDALTPMLSSLAAAGSCSEPLEFPAAAFPETDYDVFMASLPPLAVVGGGSATAWWF